MGLLTSASPVFFLLVMRRVEQRMLQAQRRYHRTLITASSGMTRIKDLRRLCQLTVYVVNRTVGLVNSGLFLLNAKTQRYELIAARYRRLYPSDLSIPQQHPLIEALEQQENLLVLEELRETMIAARGGDPWSRKLAAAYAWMRKLEVKLVVPSYSNKRLLAFLVLVGRRASKPFRVSSR
jgi:hypothetical protein